MKATLLLLLLVINISVQAQQNPAPENIFIVTIDGFRWQELFTGADSNIIQNPNFTADAELTALRFWEDDETARRKKLLPFFWNVVAAKGQMWGNRNKENKVDAANFYKISYPGYNEILTGTTDFTISTNKAKTNANVNILEYLNDDSNYKGKVVAFSSWDVFPHILGADRNHLPVFSGYEPLPDNTDNETQQTLNTLLQQTAVKENTRKDAITFLSAKEYIQQHKPKVVLLSFGETDYWAHNKQYDQYLQHAAEIDKMIADLWQLIQTNPMYKNKTTLLITSDHGRGSSAKKWNVHNFLTRGSSQSWLAAIGVGIAAKGEIEKPQQLYLQQISYSIASLLNIPFNNQHKTLHSIDFAGID
jgi:hypothetical protein